MSVINKVTVAGTTYDIQDAQATADVADLKSAIGDLDDIPDILDIRTQTGGVIFTGEQSNDYMITVNVSTLAVVESGKVHSVKANVTGSVNINITKLFSSRFIICTFTTEPQLGNTAIRRIDNPQSTLSYDMTLNSGENWLLITFYHNDEDATRNVTTIQDSITITSADALLKYSKRLDDDETELESVSANAAAALNVASTANTMASASYDAIGLNGSVNLFNPADGHGNNLLTINQGSMIFVASSKVHSMWCEIPSSTVISINKPISSRFVVGTSTNAPAANVSVSQVADVSASRTSYTLTSGANDKYLLVAYYHNDEDSGRDIDTICNGIKVFVGETWETGMSNFLRPLTAMPSYMTKLLSYRPLGPLTKPYICLSCDDGEATLATDTIPALKGYKSTYGQNIPVTFGLLNTSPVITNQTYLALVQEMVSGYGCSVAVHGAVTFTDFDEVGLQVEIAAQQTALVNAGLNPNGIIYPQHSFNDMVCAVAGGQYGVCCTGGNYTDLTYGEGNACGPRSNMYALYRLSLFNSSMTTQKIHDYVDYIVENNMLMCAFWHDSSFATNHALLDELVSYAISKGIGFIRIEDIPNII